MRQLIILSILFIALTCGGCAELNELGLPSLRFSPSESQKQTAELTYLLAKDIHAVGTETGSEESRKLVKGTELSLSYMGRSRQVPDLDQFDSISNRVGTEESSMGLLLELGLGALALVGGGTGVKLASSLRKLSSKAKGFEEVVKNTELYKQMTTEDEWNKFKRAQVTQTEATRRLVAEVSAATKMQTGRVIDGPVI